MAILARLRCAGFDSDALVQSYSTSTRLDFRLNYFPSNDRISEGSLPMAEGTIKRLTDKGFGFIETGTGKDLFFHMSACEGVRFEELQQGQKVSFTEGQGPKGPRAENVKLI
jgi:cold shock protein